MEGGVEAGDRRHPGQQPADRGDRLQRLWLVKRCEVDQRAQVADDPGIDLDRTREPGAPVDDAVAHGVQPACLPDRRFQRLRIDPAAGAVELVLRQRPIGVVEESQLEAAGTRVDDQDRQARLRPASRAGPARSSP